MLIFRCVLAAFLILVGSDLAAHGKVERKVVTIYADNGRNIAIGTGFLVGDAGIVATNYHVIKGARSSWVYSSSGKKFEDIIVLNIDPINDLALLRVVGLRGKPLNFSKIVPPPHHRLMLVGSPRGVPNQTVFAHTTQADFISSLQLSDINGQPIFDADVQVIPLDVTIYGGMSGAPLITSDGKVVGILQGSYDEGGGVAWAIPSEVLIDLLKQEGSPQRLSNIVNWPDLEAGDASQRNLAQAAILREAETIKWIEGRLNQYMNFKFGRELSNDSCEDGRNVYDNRVAELEILDEILSINITYEVSCGNAKYSDPSTTRRYVRTWNLQIPHIRSVDVAECREKNCGLFYPAPYFFKILCYQDISCISQTLRDYSKQVTDRFPPADYDHIYRIALYDENMAKRVAQAIMHLVRLQGGPRDRDDFFGEQ